VEPQEVNDLIRQVAESEAWEAGGAGWPYFHVKAIAIKQMELEGRIRRLERGEGAPHE
jgi:hypothetical protein